MSTRSFRRHGPWMLLGVLALAITACSRSGPGTSQPGTNTVSGKVTHKGAALPYGFVVFYGHEKTPDGGEPKWVSVGASPIGEDGTYEIVTAPEGPVFICVMTDPDLDVATILSPEGKGPAGPPMLGGGPPMLGGGPPMLGGGPPMAGKFPDDKMPPRLDVPPNPLASHLTDEQKKLLKELHKRYGQVGGTPLLLEVKAGSQTFDIPLS